MPEVDFPFLARTLKLRQVHHVPTTLFLGAKAGKLYRNNVFYKKCQQYHLHLPDNFSTFSDLEQFQDYFRMIESDKITPRTFELILNEALSNIAVNPSELLLAELIKQSIFHPFLLTTNIDSSLERSLELAEVQNFSVFQLQPSPGGHQSYQPGTLIKVVKVFGTFYHPKYIPSNVIPFKERPLHFGQYEDLRQEISTACQNPMLMIGVDPVWDRDFLAQMTPHVGNDLWYIDDVLPQHNEGFLRTLTDQNALYFIHPEGNFESFFHILHWHITQDVPEVYTVLDTLIDLHVNEVQVAEQKMDHLLMNQIDASTNIINFFGVHGIGKTSLLHKIKQRCSLKSLPCLLLDVEAPLRGIWQDILDQLQRSAVPFTGPGSADHYVARQAIAALKEHLEEKPLVLLFDSVDARNQTHVSSIEKILKEVEGLTTLLIIIASKQRFAFQNQPSLARKLQARQIKLFDLASARAYVNRIGQQIAPSDREWIIEQSRGYPLRMTVLAQAMLGDRLSSQTPENRSRLLATLDHLIIDKKILAGVEPDQLDHYRSILRLISIPRRITLSLFKELLFEFEPDLDVPVPLEDYCWKLFSLFPNKIGLMEWSQQILGRAVEEPMRTLNCNLMRYFEPQRFAAINEYLVQHNYRNLDRDLKYWREYLYHCAIIRASQDLPQIIRALGERLDDATMDARDQLLQEVKGDSELQEILGEHFGLLEAVIRDHLPSAEGEM